MNKQGLDLDSFLKIVLAVVGLVLVIGIIGKALSGTFYDSDAEAAKQVLSSLMNKADALQDGENNSFITRGVNNWYLVGWNLDDGDKRPKKCFLHNCICVCESPTKEKCDSYSSTCFAVKDYSVSVSTASFDEVRPPSGPGGLASKIHYEPPCIILKNGFDIVTISKSSSGLNFSYVDAHPEDRPYSICGNWNIVPF
jgi:hypothetical protein